MSSPSNQTPIFPSQITDYNSLALYLTQQEAGKKEVDIAQMREILRILRNLLVVRPQLLEILTLEQLLLTRVPTQQVWTIVRSVGKAEDDA